MIVPLMGLSLLFTPVALTECKPVLQTPAVEVKIDRQAPVFAYGQSAADLTQQSIAGKAYQPEGLLAQGPKWHTTGLTQSNITFKYNQEGRSLTASDNSYACIFVDRITITIVLAPTVTIANEYPSGSCMYNAVRDHEMKHVNADRIISLAHQKDITQAVTLVSRNRAFMGPAAPQQVQSQAKQLQADVTVIMNQQIDAFYRDELKATRGIDTMEEYQRISRLCPDQRNAIH